MRQQNIMSRNINTFLLSFVMQPKLVAMFVLWAEKILCQKEQPNQWWFSLFKKGNFDLKKEECSSHPIKLDEDQVNELLYKNSRRWLEDIWKVGEWTIEVWWEICRKLLLFDTESPKTLSMGSTSSEQNNKPQRLTIATGWFSCHKFTRECKWKFFHCIITGRERWCVYVNLNYLKQRLSSTKKLTLQVRTKAAFLKDDDVLLGGNFSFFLLFSINFLQKKKTIIAALVV